LRERRECIVESSGFRDSNRGHGDTQRTRGILDSAELEFCHRNVGNEQDTDPRHCRDHHQKRFEQLGAQFLALVGEASQVAVGSRQASTPLLRTGSPPLACTIGMLVVAFDAASAETAPDTTMTSTLRRNQFGREGGRTIRPAVFDRQVLSLDVASFGQASALPGPPR
jgi:hypothetical protein